MVAHLDWVHQSLQQLHSLCLQKRAPGSRVVAHEGLRGLSTGVLLQQGLHQRDTEPALLLCEEVLQGIVHHLSREIQTAQCSMYKLSM